jgi:hypothetical protein
MEQRMHVLIGWFVAASFCVCFASFAFCYAFMPVIAKRRSGQMRSLSGIMKAESFKPYFCFVMGCLGGSLFLASCIQALDEISAFQRDYVLFVSFGLYVCLIGLVNYDMRYSKTVHFSFVFVLIVFGYVFSNSALNHDAHSWGPVASAAYNISTSMFLMCIFLNFHLQSQGLTDYLSVQACLEIVWVLGLVLMVCVYAFDTTSSYDADRKVHQGSATIPMILRVSLGMCSAVCFLLSGLFYATPDLGFCSFTGTLSCFCQIVSKTSPHFAFLLHILSGLLLICLCTRATEKQTETLILSGFVFIGLNGLLSFDIRKCKCAHFGFVFTLFISALVFSLLEWNDSGGVWHRAGTIAYCVGLGLLFLNPFLDHFVFDFEEMTAINIANHMQLLCITAMVFMFGVFVYT